MSRALLRDACALKCARGEVAVVAAIVLFALLLRGCGIGTFPREYATADESFYVWSGLSLLHEGQPIAWSDLKAYDQNHGLVGNVQFEGRTFRMVTPALDHPPVFSLLAGATANLIGGAQSLSLETDAGSQLQMWRFNLARTRMLSMVLSVVTLLLLYAAAREALGRAAAVVALLLFATTSHIVIHQRLLVTENLTTPLLLLNVWAWLRYRHGCLSRRAFAAITLAAVPLAMLSKVVAASHAASIAFLALTGQRRRDALYPVAGVMIGAALLLAYGAWQSWDIFISIMASQASRLYGFDALRAILTQPTLVHEPSVSFVLLAGWIAVFMMMGRSEGRDLFIAATVYLIAFAFFSAVPSIYGWHIIPFYPFLSIALGALVVQAYREGGGMAVLAIALLLPWGLTVMYTRSPSTRGWLRMAYLAVCGVGLAAQGVPEQYRKPITGYTLILAIALCQIGEVWDVIERSTWAD